MEWINRGKEIMRERRGRIRRTPRAGGHDDFLPNFCNGWVVFNVAVGAELLAIVIDLVAPRGLFSRNGWVDLLLVSLYVQWIALAGTATLCYTRRYLNALPRLRALAMAYLLLLCVTFVVSAIAPGLLWVSGKIGTPYPPWANDYEILTLTIAAIAYGLLLRFLLAKHELTQRAASEARARIQALQARIRPHFVFNSLNIIASLTRTDPPKAETAIEDMADLFRMMLSEDEALVPIRKEIEVAQKYLAIETLRLDSRLTVRWDIGTFRRQAVMPILTLQPLLEGVIRQGIEELPEGGTVDVRLWEDGDQIHIRIASPHPPPRSRSRSPRAAAAAPFDNIRERLRGHYGDSAVLDTVVENGHTNVTVVLPTRGGKP